ncbi:MAG: hypothetical protein OEM01_02270 [Desulfobulbaceae bacterium]|nr:hypothetical protein [Desulfobulbaceae bacterium]
MPVVAQGPIVQFSRAVLTDTPEGLQTLDLSTPKSLTGGTTLQIYIEWKPGGI